MGDVRRLRRLVSGRTEDETRREVAYIGWFILRPVIREARSDHAELGRTLRRGARRVRRRKETVWIDLTPKERADLALQYSELGRWIVQLEGERAANGRIAGDLIAEIDR